MVKKVKVLHVIYSSGAGGAERLLSDIKENLDPERFDLAVCVLSNKQEFFFNGRASNNVFYLNKRNGPDPSVLFKIGKLVKNFDPDIVCVHSVYSLKYVLPITFAKQKKTAITLHNDLKKLLGWRAWYYLVIIKIFRLYVINISKSLNSAFMFDKARSVTITNWISPIFFRKTVPLEIRDKQFKIINIGRFYPQKNHIFLVREFIKFHDRHPDSTLVLIGEGSLKNEIAKLASVCPDIIFKKSEKNVIREYLSADLLIVPSLFEGLPLVVIEAMACGLPVLMSSFQTAQDLAVDPKNQIFRINDSDDFQKKLEHLFADNRLRQQIASRSQKAAQKYRIGPSIEKLERFYLKISS